MAARSRRRVSRVRRNGVCIEGDENTKSAKTLQLADVLCCVCRSLLVEPVSLPCRHRFCRACWLASDALRCPLCRTRVGSWLRESARRNLNLVDEELWRAIRDKFPEELNRKLKGEDVDFPNDVPVPRLSAPGEIRAEYEAELRRLRGERVQLEQRHSEETERLVRRLQQEEEEAHKSYLEKVKQDEQLARQLAASDEPARPNGTLKSTTTDGPKRNVKPTTIDRFLVKKTPKKLAPSKESPLVTDDSSSGAASSGGAGAVDVTAATSGPSPELVPSYGRFLKLYLDKKFRHLTGSVLPKETRGTVKTWVPPSDAKHTSAQKEFSVGSKPPIRTKGAQKQLCPVAPAPSCSLVQSVPVSLPYSGLLNQKAAALRWQLASSAETDSVDSMRQELCYFKPIHPTVTASRNKNDPCEVVRVPAVRTATPTLAPATAPPDYLKGLRLLRGECALTTPSAFVCLLSLLQGDAAKCDISEVIFKSKTEPDDLLHGNANIAPITREERPNGKNEDTKLRRTRSTGNIPKLVKESAFKQETPKKKRLAASTKAKSKSEVKEPSKCYLGSPSLVPEPVIDYSKVSLVANNLSSPFAICDTAVSENKREKVFKCPDYAAESNNNEAAPRKSKRRASEKAVEAARAEQERRDLELARRLQAEWNGSRVAGKRRPCRQLTLAHFKKMKA